MGKAASELQEGEHCSPLRGASPLQRCMGWHAGTRGIGIRGRDAV